MARECPKCDGSGKQDCARCDGTGRITVMDIETVLDMGHVSNSEEVECPKCNGSGYEPCSRCDGAGTV
jgi:DnaJ-class molecular chaperone